MDEPEETFAPGPSMPDGFVYALEITDVAELLPAMWAWPWLRANRPAPVGSPPPPLPEVMDVRCALGAASIRGNLATGSGSFNFLEGETQSEKNGYILGTDTAVSVLLDILSSGGPDWVKPAHASPGSVVVWDPPGLYTVGTNTEGQATISFGERPLKTDIDMGVSGWPQGPASSYQAAPEYIGVPAPTTVGSVVLTLGDRVPLVDRVITLSCRDAGTALFQNPSSGGSVVGGNFVIWYTNSPMVTVEMLPGVNPAGGAAITADVDDITDEKNDPRADDVSVEFFPGITTFVPVGGSSETTSVLKVELITPAGDPVDAAVQSGDGQNEFTYSPANPGVLTMNLKAKVTPSGMANQIKDQCLFTVDAIAGSTLAWAAANPGGKPTASGDDLLATVTFTGLPANNTALGSKKAAVYFNTCKQDEESYEVFFPRDVANHPGGVAADPNWFYYWGQVYVNANVQYVAASGVGRTPAMTTWTYNAVPSKTRIEIGNGHPAKYKSYGIGEEASGVDRYVMTVIHEEKHVAQIAAADALLPTSGANSFRFGWSWNQATHNHWTKGPDGQWGIAGVDDDGNSTVDDAAVVPPFEPGNGDDVSLDNATWPWWPNTWALPGGVYATIHPIEGEAVKAADDAMNENDYAPQDWGDPGKNHKTVNKWDD